MSHKTKNMTSSPSTSSEKNVAGGHEMTPTPNLKIFSFSELRVATRNLGPDTVRGEGGFGRVYKGYLKEKHNVKLGTEIVVAIKKLNPDGMQGLQEWLSEVNFVGRLSHPNLVKLLGYCSEDQELLLVYEFMRKGSLENHLFARGSSIQPLPWDIRLKILVGAARGLTFLHTLETTVIHRDFKASNILLDQSYNAKLSDFGLAKSKPMDGSSHVSTEVMGTDGYVDPEYVATGHLTVKSDVYGFGVVLVEMLTGLRAFDLNRPSGQQNLVDWIKPHLSERRKLINIMDARLEGSYPRKSCVKIAGLALNCLALDPKDRPDMAQVLDTLEKLYAARDQPRVQFHRDGNEPRRPIRAHDKPRV